MMQGHNTLENLCMKTTYCLPLLRTKLYELTLSLIKQIHLLKGSRVKELKWREPHISGPFLIE